MPLTVLRQKGKRQKPTETRGRINIRLSISQRPAEVRGRRTFGHWELDTVVSGRGKSKACVATFIERKSRFYLALPIADRTAASMEGAIHAVHAAFPEGTFRTAMTDRGKEFSCHERARRAAVFRRPVLVVAARQQRERQRPPARVLPERIGLRDGRPRRDRGRARQDQRAAEEMSRLEDRTRGLRGGSVALNLTNRLLLNLTR